jgi:hypothetical protein
MTSFISSEQLPKQSGNFDSNSGCANSQVGICSSDDPTTHCCVAPMRTVLCDGDASCLSAGQCQGGACSDFVRFEQGSCGGSLLTTRGEVLQTSGSTQYVTRASDGGDFYWCATAAPAAPQAVTVANPQFAAIVAGSNGGASTVTDVRTCPPIASSDLQEIAFAGGEEPTMDNAVRTFIEGAAAAQHLLHGANPSTWGPPKGYVVGDPDTGKFYYNAVSGETACPQ